MLNINNHYLKCSVDVQVLLKNCGLPSDAPELSSFAEPYITHFTAEVGYEYANNLSVEISDVGILLNIHKIIN